MEWAAPRRKVAVLPGVSSRAAARAVGEAARMISQAVAPATVAHKNPVRPQPITNVAAATVTILLVAGALAASADSLPDSTLYPLKGVLENVRGALTFSQSDRLVQHLDLAKTRLTEAEAMLARHRVDLAGRALNALNDQLNVAAELVQNAKQSDPAIGAAMQNRLSQAIATDDKQLVVLQGQAANPTAASALAQARDRAAEALKVAQAPASPNSQSSPSASPSGTAQGQGATSSPQPTTTP